MGDTAILRHLNQVVMSALNMIGAIKYSVENSGEDGPMRSTTDCLHWILDVPTSDALEDIIRGQEVPTSGSLFAT